jgi:hypothetical protein
MFSVSGLKERISGDGKKVRRWRGHIELVIVYLGW